MNPRKRIHRQDQSQTCNRIASLGHALEILERDLARLVIVEEAEGLH